MAASKKFRLNNGLDMPAIGMGTYRITSEQKIAEVVEMALAAGYRLFDTARVYNNEIQLMKAFKALLPKFELTRKDIFITTKLDPSKLRGSPHVDREIIQSLHNLETDYIDLYLIHWPGNPEVAPRHGMNKQMRQLTWEALVDLNKSGYAKSIGVSNYNCRHLYELLENNMGVIPAVNQVEWHPYYNQPELLELCKSNDIILQAYCPFGGTANNDASLLSDPKVVAVANKHNVSAGQVLIAWAIQQGVSVIPKASSPQHIKENVTIDFTLSTQDLDEINELRKKNIKYAWDPNKIY